MVKDMKAITKQHTKERVRIKPIMIKNSFHLIDTLSVKALEVESEIFGLRSTKEVKQIEEFSGLKLIF